MSPELARIDLLDLLLRLASQPTLNADLSLQLQVERGR